MNTKLEAYRFIASFRSPIVLILIICLVTGVPRHAFAGTWTTQSGAPAHNLTGIASSANGQDLVVGTTDSNDVWMSTDYGVTWTMVLDSTDSNNHPWSSFAMSSDGTEIIGVQNGGYIWESYNSGTSWTEAGLGAEAWSGVAMTADGENIAAVAGNNEVIDLSYDGGDTWLPADGQPGDPALPATGHWYSAAYSPSNDYLVLGGGLNGTAYLAVSSHKGSTWDAIDFSSGLGNWFAVSVNDAGDIVAAGEYSSTGYVRTSINAGGSLTTQSIGSASHNWTGSAISNDGSGSVITLTASGGDIYLSTDAGADWAAQNAPGVQTWTGVTESSDGTRIAASAGSGILYTYNSAVSSGGGNNNQAHSIPAKPVLLLGTVTSTSVTAQSGATEQNGITNVGIEYGVNGTSTSTLTHKDFPTNGPFQYSLALAGLTCGTQYQITPYSTNSFGTTYGDMQNFMTLACPVTSSVAISSGTTSTTNAMSTPPAFNPGGPMIPVTSATSSATSSPVMIPSSTFSFTRNLERGMSGTDVTALQQFLIAASIGPSAKALAAAGTSSYFGSLTKAALIEYQKANAIKPASGYFGPLTRAHITVQSS